MERVIILKNTDTGQALTLPVTPKSYPIAAGRAVERLDMAQTGQIALPGLRSLFSGTLEFQLPAVRRPYMTAGAAADPQSYIDLLTAWSTDANLCRYIVAGTAVNIPVLLGPLEYGEEDGTNDVYCKLPLYEYRILDEAAVERPTQNNARPVEGSAQTQTADSYTVVRGDCLWNIARRVYGDGALCYKLAAANGIQNPNLIYPGQELVLPDRETLAGYEPVPAQPLPGTVEARTEEVQEASTDSRKAAVNQRAAGRQARWTGEEIRAAIGLGAK